MLALTIKAHDSSATHSAIARAPGEWAKLRHEIPQDPDLVLDNYGTLDVITAVDRIMAECAGSNGAAPTHLLRIIEFKTKAETLEALAPLRQSARVLPQVRFSAAAVPWSSGRLIVRRSGHSEDSAGSSQAGKYDSIPSVLGRAEVAQAIARVVESLSDGGIEHDQVSVQQMLDNVSMAGVAFSRTPSGAPYFVVN